MFGDPKLIPNQKSPLTVRVHDECNGSDVFGSDICTCRPYLIHGIELPYSFQPENSAKNVDAFPVNPFKGINREGVDFFR